MNPISDGQFSECFGNISEKFETNNPWASLVEKISFIASHLWKAACCKLIQTGKIFHHTVPGVVYREKAEMPTPILLSATGPADLEPLTALQNFEVCSKLPFESPSLYLSQIRKAQELLTGNLPENDLRTLKKMLDTALRPGSARNDFSCEDWEALDRVNFDLIQEHFATLVQLFNGSALNTIENTLKQSYGVDYKEALIAEALAKSLAPIPGLDGKPIRMPVKDALGSYRLTNFIIRHAPLGDNLPCYILESDDPAAVPWIAIRGTESIRSKASDSRELRPGGAESLWADCIDAEGLAQDVITKAMVVRPVVREGNFLVQRESLLERFIAWNQNGKKVNVTGHSLGGYLTNEMALRFYDEVGAGYAFSPTGVSFKQEACWKENVRRDMESTGKSEEEANRKLVNFDVEGDLIPSAGRKLIGLHLAVEPIGRSGPIDPIHAHLGHNLNKSFYVQRIHVEKENSKLLRRISEGLRANFGRMMRVYVEAVDPKSLPDWWKNRRFYREAVRHTSSRSV